MEKQNTKLDIDRIIFIGRTFDEYIDMFNLQNENLKDKKLLDCPAGACSFTALGRNNGLDVKACDIAYTFETNDLYNKGQQDVAHAIEKMELSKSNYNWNYFKNTSELKTHRLQALEDCTEDMKKYPESYRYVSLPELPYEDNEFDILLSAHFLFMYSDRLDYQYHIQTINEMLRVTREEIRIFPLINLEGKRYEYLNDVIKYLNELGYITEEIKVDYEFQTNANTMLSIKMK